MPRVSTVLLLATTLVLLSDIALAQHQFDGRWSIEASPEKGDCRRVHRFPINIESGTIRSGRRRINIQGRVQPAGRISGSFEIRQTRVDVAGDLSERSGSGTWTSAGKANCSGRWNAERRS